jgi:hypothetical protein
MGKQEFDRLKYLGKVFKGLSFEKKDHVLIVARALLKVQNNDALLNDYSVRAGRCLRRKR